MLIIVQIVVVINARANHATNPGKPVTESTYTEPATALPAR